MDALHYHLGDIGVVAVDDDESKAQIGELIDYVGTCASRAVVDAAAYDATREDKE